MQAARAELSVEAAALQAAIAERDALLAARLSLINTQERHSGVVEKEVAEVRAKLASKEAEEKKAKDEAAARKKSSWWPLGRRGARATDALSRPQNTLRQDANGKWVIEGDVTGENDELQAAAAVGALDCVRVCVCVCVGAAVNVDCV